MSEQKGLTGLANLGNTCFINSCIQVLSHTNELNSFLDGDYKAKLSAYRDKKYLVDSRLVIEYDKLRRLMWSQNCKISPVAFLRSIQQTARQKGKDIFTGYAQNDLPEFLLFIIDTFHNGLHREVEMNIKGSIKNKQDEMATKCLKMYMNMYGKEYSEILELFYAIHVSKIKKISSDEVLSVTPEPFFIMDIPLPENKNELTLIECIDLYCNGEVLEGENGWYNEKTKEKEDVVKKISFWNLPKILVIDLKRFTFNGKKRQNPIDLELDNLDLSKYVDGYDKESYVYELYGVCNHSGGTLGGHYTSLVRAKDRKWYLFNDTEVKEVGFDGKNNSSGYCLFYRKKY